MKRTLLTLLSCLLVCVLCSAIPKSSKAHVESIQVGIEQILKTLDPKVHVGLEVRSVKTGQNLYQKNSQNLFIPASTVKIFTAAAALHILGPQYQFETAFFTDGTIQDGVLVGNLYLKGSGDPSLLFQDLQEMIFRLSMLQIKEIRGNLLIDNTDFDGIVQGPGWMWDDGWMWDKEANLWNAPMDAIVVNHNCLKVWIAPACAATLPPLVYLSPQTSYLTVRNRAQTLSEEGKLEVKRELFAKESCIQISGMLPLNCALKSYHVAVPSPAFYAAHLCSEQLLAQGIVFKGEMLLAKTPASARLLASHLSVPLCSTLQDMLKTSDNLYATCFLKKIGQISSKGIGTWQNGAEAVRRFLAKEAGIDVSEMVFLDGSGESRYNLVSPHQMVAFLSWMHNRFGLAAECIAALPISGIDGCLKQRMTGEGVRGKVRAKGGTMTGVSGLAGYVSTKDGDVLAFSLLASGFVGSAAEFKSQVEDKICTFLANYSR